MCLRELTDKKGKCLPVATSVWKKGSLPLLTRAGFNDSETSTQKCTGKLLSFQNTM